MSNNEFLVKNYSLLQDCVKYQVAKYGCPKELTDDLMQEISLIVLSYPQDKLNDVVSKHHENAWMTAVLVRTLYSKNSQFYRTFRKFSSITDDLDELEYKL